MTGDDINIKHIKVLDCLLQMDEHYHRATERSVRAERLIGKVLISPQASNQNVKLRWQPFFWLSSGSRDADVGYVVLSFIFERQEDNPATGIKYNIHCAGVHRSPKARGRRALGKTSAECRVSFGRRSVPPGTSEAFLADMGPHLEGWLPDENDVEVSAAHPEGPDPEAFATEESAELVQVLDEVSGGEMRSVDGGTEAPYFAEDAPPWLCSVRAEQPTTMARSHIRRESASRSRPSRRTLRWYGRRPNGYAEIDFNQINSEVASPCNTH